MTLLKFIDRDEGFYYSKPESIAHDKIYQKKEILGLRPELGYPKQVLISPQKWAHIRTPSTDVNELVEMLGWVFRKVDSRRQ